MTLQDQLVPHLCGVRDLVRGNDRRVALARLLFAFGERSDVIDPANRLDVSTALAALGGDLRDLDRGRPVAWATPSRAKAGHRPYTPLPGGRECHDFGEWQLRQLATVRNRVWEGDRRGALVELIGTAHECALLLIDGDHRHAVAGALDMLLKDVLGLYRGKQPEWLLPEGRVKDDGELQKGPKPSTGLEQCRRTLIALAYRMHRNLGGTRKGAMHGVCKRSGCTEQELKTWCKHLRGDRRLLEEHTLADELQGFLKESAELARRSSPLQGRATLLAGLEAALADRP
jgi:hypothetical protein